MKLTLIVFLQTTKDMLFFWKAGSIITKIETR